MLFFKKILSYFVDVHLEKASTPINPVLEISLRKGRFYLTTTNAVYSFGDLYDNFTNTFKRMDFEKNNLKSLLVLGFGMGSVPFMLERIFGQKFLCVGVEADAKIAGWAERYVLPTLKNPVSLLVADALDFAEKHNQKFDLVVVDIFLDNLVPKQFETVEFLKNTKKMLSKNGVLLFNRLADTETARSTTLDFYEKNFKAVFPEGVFLEVDENWILANRQAWD